MLNRCIWKAILSEVIYQSPLNWTILYIKFNTIFFIKTNKNEHFCLEYIHWVTICWIKNQIVRKLFSKINKKFKK